MTDDELAMAYADGELDPLAARRFERRLAAEAGLAGRVAAERRLRDALRGGFDPVLAQPVPRRLTDLVGAGVVPLRPRRLAPVPWAGLRWAVPGAIAASLAAGLLIGHAARQTAGGVTGESAVAAGTLARTLDGDLAGGDAATRVLVSFRRADGGYCRVFAAAAVDGIACRTAAGWTLDRTEAAGPAAAGTYRQAASRDADLFARAQRMMAGAPLDRDGERRARARGWR